MNEFPDHKYKRIATHTWPVNLLPSPCCFCMSAVNGLWQNLTGGTENSGFCTAAVQYGLHFVWYISFKKASKEGRENYVMVVKDMCSKAQAKRYLLSVVLSNGQIKEMPFNLIEWKWKICTNYAAD